MFWKKQDEHGVLKSSRKKCYEARDAFFACVDELGSGFQAGQPVPADCKDLRKKYEECCSASWVAHFDKLRDQDVRRVRALHANINDNHQKSKGVEAGKPLG